MNIARKDDARTQIIVEGTEMIDTMITAGDGEMMIVDIVVVVPTTDKIEGTMINRECHHHKRKKLLLLLLHRHMQRPQPLDQI